MQLVANLLTDIFQCFQILDDGYMVFDKLYHHALMRNKSSINSGYEQ